MGISGLESRYSIKHRIKEDLVCHVLRGNGLHHWVEQEIAEKLVDHYLPVSYFKRKASEMNYKFSDYLIMEFTKKIKNTKIARKVHKNNMIKYYGENEEWIRILK